MGRVLTIARATVVPAARAAYVTSLAEKRAHYTRADCRFWVFEEVERAGVFVEFVEAGDAETLHTARAHAPETSHDARTYSEVEIA